jgi:two-component system response regulator FixJ
VHCEYLRIGRKEHCSENYVPRLVWLPMIPKETVMTEKAPVVVVVDDDPAARTSLRLLLKSLGIAAVTYESAAAFLAEFDPEQPGCLLLDIRMPIMSGLQLQQQLHERGNVAPVIFLTGHGDITMAVEAMRQGAFDFLQKPFRDQDLLDQVQKALAKDRARRDEPRADESIRQRLESLTPRESEVLELVTGVY